MARKGKHSSSLGYRRKGTRYTKKANYKIRDVNIRNEVSYNDDIIEEEEEEVVTGNIILDINDNNNPVENDDEMPEIEEDVTRQKYILVYGERFLKNGKFFTCLSQNIKEWILPMEIISNIGLVTMA